MGDAIMKNKSGWKEPAPPEDPRKLEEELTPETRIGHFMGLSLHIVHGWERPACMAEIGRIRELEFRTVGAGRNVSRDIDPLDTTPGSYRQLIAWDPQNRELVSMYRYTDTARVIQQTGLEGLRTHSLFEFSRVFQDHYLSRAIELGRSVVNSRAQRAVAGLFAVWRGLGILLSESESVAYFFGNVTISASLPAAASDLLLRFLYRYYSSEERREMVRARPGTGYSFTTTPVPLPAEAEAGRKKLVEQFAALGISVPPILLSYLGAADELHVFDTARDGDFGGAWETALAVPVASLNAKTRHRFIDGYQREPGGYFAARAIVEVETGPVRACRLPSLS